ncbi:CAP domain-containing protein [Nocardia sp. CDC159]|uniref:CAP domain-containing protein n=1 Tax=Nocardia pulmonis TaxID=2951408 RepID=A0A9X2J026_9NOCA|nr:MULTISPECIES: CAP domain-containing protein [Nocardia]MCM6775571.1 CAP domain-containing protein [Nocardia pulmonis]MCM6787695.1 CAP domain-containing protein [Nocardia sp. CDC159]
MRSLSATVGLSAFALATIAGATSASAAPQSDSAAADEVVTLTNAERAKAGCQPLKAENRLTQAAQGHSEDMAKNNFFDHNSSKGSPGDRIAATGYKARTWAENIAMGYRDAKDVVNGWMNSPGHRANILNCGLREIGVGVAKGRQGLYWTQAFATPSGKGTDQPKPEKPTKPEKPSKPEKPTQPEKPSKPSKPEQPGKPQQPTNPWEDWFQNWFGKPGGGNPWNPWADWFGGGKEVSWDPWSNGFQTGGNDLGQLAGQGGDWSNGPRWW